MKRLSALLLVFAAVAPAQVTADLSFRCLWWSEAQMNGLNPNNPPPKTHEVTIKKWEYSDPIGVPHPDTVDLVAAIRNAPKGATAEVLVRWKQGPIERANRAVWGAWQPLRTAPAAAEVRYKIDLKGKTESPQYRARWPFAMEARLIVRSGGKQLLIKSISLPIQPGD